MHLVASQDSRSTTTNSKILSHRKQKEPQRSDIQLYTHGSQHGSVVHLTDGNGFTCTPAKICWDALRAPEPRGDSGGGGDMAVVRCAMRCAIKRLCSRGPGRDRVILHKTIDLRWGQGLSTATTTLEAGRWSTTTVTWHCGVVALTLSPAYHFLACSFFATSAAKSNLHLSTAGFLGARPWRGVFAYQLE